MHQSRQDIIALMVNELREMDVQISEEMPENLAFRADLGMDSLAVVEFVARMEQLYHIQIADDVWQTLDCVGRVADYLERLT